MTGSALRRDAAAEQLQRIIAQYGAEVIVDFSRTRAILADTMPQHAREAKILIAALEEGVPVELQSRRELPTKVVAAQLRARLERERGLSVEAANWAVEAWAAALAPPSTKSTDTVTDETATDEEAEWREVVRPYQFAIALIGGAALFGFGFAVGVVLIP